MGYRYFDFRALDSTLSAATQRELAQKAHERARVSDRQLHLIVYFGSSGIKADELLRQHFDMMLTADSYGPMELAFKLPRKSLPADRLAPYRVDIDYEGRLTLTSRREGDILSLFMHNAAPSWQEDDADWLSALTPLREELLSGDLRPLYLFWLALAAHGHVDEQALEPPVPAGMNALQEHHLAFASLFGISEGLLDAARSRSEAQRDDDDASRADALIATLEEEEVRELLRRVVLGQEMEVGRELRRKVQAAQPAPVTTTTGRTLGELVYESQEASRQLEARARETRLDELEARWEPLWREIEALLSRAYPRYEPPIRKMKTLQEVAQARPRLKDDFEARLAAIVEEYGSSTSFRKHLRHHGLD